MKHTAKITLILLALFFFTQYFGLLVVSQYVDPVASAAVGETVFGDLPIIERPDIQEEMSYIPIVIIIIIGTALLLLLIKLEAFVLWRFWFFFAVLISSSVSLGAFMPVVFALILAGILGIWKTFKPNPIIHNFTEPLIYAGLAAIFVPIFNLKSIVILLIVISIYDMFAVWQSKHMVKLAQAQAKAKVFAGLFIPYNKEGKVVTKKTTKKVSTQKEKKVKGKREIPRPQVVRSAILGGGDIGFPLFFAGVVFKEFGMLPALIIPLFASAGLGLLFYYSEDKKFYPAMPPITIACLLGLAFVWLIGLL